MNIITLGIIVTLMGLFTQFMYNLMVEQGLVEDRSSGNKTLIYITIFSLSPVFFMGLVWVTIKSLFKNIRNEYRNRKKD